MRLKSCIISLGLEMAVECVKSKNLIADKTHELIIFYLTVFGLNSQEYNNTESKNN